MKPSDVDKTAFVLPNALYCFLTMPFGAKNSPMTFMRTIVKILKKELDLRQICAFLDDILVQGLTVEDHLAILELVLSKFWKHNLKIKASKCELFRSKVTFLGHEVTKEGLQCESSKIDAIRNYPVPQTPKEVRQALGLFSFYRRHVKNFSQIAKPLYSLTRKDCKFEWTSECDSAFRHLIHRLTTAPILANPRVGEELILTTDASLFAIGALLSVKREGIRHPVAYGSHLLSKAQSNYSATKRELYAIVFFAQAFKFYLLGLPHFVVETDHRPLTWLTSFHDPPALIARWIEILSQFNFSIVYRSGAENQAADALSRIRPEPTCLPLSQNREVNAGEKEEKLPDPKSEPQPLKGEINHECNLIMDQIAPSQNIDSLVAHENNPDEEEIPASEVIPLPSLLASEQRKDTALKRLREIVFQDSAAVPDQEPPVTMYYLNKRENLVIHPDKDALFYKDKDDHHRILVPHHQRIKVLRAVHSDPTGGHRSAAKMLTVLKPAFHWKGMRYDSELFAKNCESCGLMKKPTRRPNASVSFTFSSARLQKCSIDIVGKLPRSKKGNIFILTVLDCFTKFAWAFPLSRITSEAIADKLINHIFSVFGLPVQIQSDAGSQLISQIMQELYSILGIKQKKSLPWQPRCNGIVERLHRTLEGSLAHWAHLKPRSWDRIVPLCILSYNSQASRSTGLSPFKLMFGTNARLPVHFLFGQPPLAEDLPEYEYNIWLEETLYGLEEQARTKLNSTIQGMKAYTDKRQFGKPLEPGQYVWLLKGAFEKGCRKFARQYTGPYKVKEKRSNATYMLQETKPPCRTFLAHFNRLKRCHLPAATLEALDDVIQAELNRRRAEARASDQSALTDASDVEPFSDLQSNGDEEVVILRTNIQPEAPIAREAPQNQPIASAPVPITEPRRSARLAVRPRRRYDVYHYQRLRFKLK